MKGSGGGEDYIHTLCESLAVTRMANAPLTSAAMRFYPPSSELQRYGRLRQQAATAH